MQYIRLTNGTEFPVLGVHSQSIMYNGIQREHLIFLFDSLEVTLAEIQESFTPENCKNIVIGAPTDALDEAGQPEYEEFVHPYYSIMLGLGYANRNKVINAPTIGSSNPDDVTNEASELDMVNFVKMVQTTLAERSIENQQEVLDALVVEALMREAE